MQRIGLLLRSTHEPHDYPPHNLNSSVSNRMQQPLATQRRTAASAYGDQWLRPARRGGRSIAPATVRPKVASSDRLIAVRISGSLSS